MCRDTDLDAAVRAVHDAFELGGDRARPSSTRGPAGEPPAWAALPTLAVVGATGAVGTVMLELLSCPARRLGRDPAGRVGALGRAELRVRGEDVTVRALAPEVFDGVDVAMFDVPDEVSAQWAPIAAARGAVVVDNSGAFRMDPDVPLVVPEVNPEQAARTGRRGSSPTPTARR